MFSPVSPSHPKQVWDFLKQGLVFTEKNIKTELKITFIERRDKFGCRSAAPRVSEKE